MNRGKPWNTSDTHYQHPIINKLEPFCRNGSYHVKITNIKKLTTCEVCKKLIKNNYGLWRNN